MTVKVIAMYRECTASEDSVYLLTEHFLTSFCSVVVSLSGYWKFPQFTSCKNASNDSFKIGLHVWLLYCPAVFGHFSPAPRKNRSCNTNPINQSSQSSLIVNQSINWKVYNESLRLIDWFNPSSEKVPQGNDFRVGETPIGKNLDFIWRGITNRNPIGHDSRWKAFQWMSF